MSFSRDTFIDLLAICSSAPYGGCRFAANVLLARERIARRAAEGYESRLQDRQTGELAPPYMDFAWRDQELASTAPGLDALVYLNPTAPAYALLPSGYSDSQHALYYLSYPNGWSAAEIGPTTPFGPYPAVLADAVSRAAKLRTVVINGVTIGTVNVFDGMGSVAYAAARAPYEAFFAAYDFAQQNIFSYYAFGGDCTAAANATFPLVSFTLAPGYNAIIPPATPAIIVPASGSYSVKTDGYVRSASTANPTTITLSLRVSGVEVASRSVVRNSADPTEAVRLPTHVDVVTINGPFTVVNSSSSSTESGPVSVVLWLNP
ncbi:MAG: hypothetical protein JWN04_3841 [Myxococcaceae bacterium]|nr:hypothetical protein [Myxococcaceae bacterium]